MSGQKYFLISQIKKNGIIENILKQTHIYISPTDSICKYVSKTFQNDISILHLAIVEFSGIDFV